MKLIKIWFMGAVLVMIAWTIAVAGNGRGAALAQAGNGLGQGGGGAYAQPGKAAAAISVRDKGPLVHVDTLPYEEPGDLEISSLGKMIQEEKLARDVYTALAEFWELPIFVNIAKSEQRHMDAIAAVIEKYGLENPVANAAAGEFADEEIQNLCAELIEKGGESAETALSVGAFIEELDIFDLKAQLESAIDNQDIGMVYEHLLQGSENHIRSFVRMLDSYGIVYSGSGYLTLEELEGILLSPHNRGMGAGQLANGA